VLAAIAANQGLFTDGFVFETGRVFLKKDEDLPDQVSRLMIAVWGTGDDDALLRRAKGLLTAYAREQGIRGLTIKRGTTGSFWHPGRSAVVSAGDRLLGMVGELHPAVRQAFGLDGRVALVELDIAGLVAASGANYAAVPALPPALRDLAVLVPEKVEYADLETAALSASPLLKIVELFDIYRGKGVEAGKKSVAVHLTFAAADRTLTSEETDAAVAAVTAALTDRFGAVKR